MSKPCPKLAAKLRKAQRALRLAEKAVARFTERGETPDWFEAMSVKTYTARAERAAAMVAADERRLARESNNEGVES